jgi:hypothetical protein
LAKTPFFAQSLSGTFSANDGGRSRPAAGAAAALFVASSFIILTVLWHFSIKGQSSTAHGDAYF